MTSTLLTRLLPHRRHLFSTAAMPPIPLAHPSFALLECSSSSSSSPNITARKHNRSYHTSPPLHRPGYKPERNPKIKISLEQLRMAARTQGRRLPICHEQHEKVMNSLEAAKYENHAIYKYVKEYHKCREDYELNHKGKDKAMMRELNKYLVRDRKK